MGDSRVRTASVPDGNLLRLGSHLGLFLLSFLPSLFLSRQSDLHHDLKVLLTFSGALPVVASLQDGSLLLVFMRL